MEVEVENLAEGEERRLCSLEVAPGMGQYQCRLNLGQEKYCAQVTQDISQISSNLAIGITEVCILGDGGKPQQPQRGGEGADIRQHHD